MMDRAFEVILDAVHRYEGAINQFLGDGVMALFGASTAHDDDPYRAVRAARGDPEDLEALRADVRRAHESIFRFGLASTQAQSLSVSSAKVCATITPPSARRPALRRAS